MKTQNVTYANNQSFTALSQGPRISKPLFDRVSKLPVVKSFAKDYDATLEVVPFMSTLDNARTQLAVRVSDIKPLKFLEKIQSFFETRKIEKEVLLKTRATNEEELVKELSHIRSNSIHRLYKNID